MSVLSVSIRFAPKYIITQALIMGGVSVSQPITNPAASILYAIKGDTGAAGMQGIQGVQGIQGIAGTNGTNGSDATVNNSNVNTAIAANLPATKSALSLSKSDVGLGNVDNTADNAKTFAPSQLTQAGASSGNALVWNGSAWAPAAISASPGGSSGQVQYNNAGAFGGLAGVTYGSNTLLHTSQAVGAIPLAVQARTSQTGNLQEWRDSVGAMQARVRSDCDIEVSSKLYFDDANGWIGRTAGSNTLAFSPSSNTTSWQMTSSVFEYLGTSASFLYTHPAATGGSQLTATIQPRDRGGNTGVGNIVNIRGGKGSTASTGTAGGASGLYGGDAAGSGNNNGGGVTIQGGAPTGSGVRGFISLLNLPTSASGLTTGAIWNNSGVVNIV